MSFRLIFFQLLLNGNFENGFSYTFLSSAVKFVLPLPRFIICFHLFGIAFIRPAYITKSNLTSYFSLTASTLKKVPD